MTKTPITTAERLAALCKPGRKITERPYLLPDGERTLATDYKAMIVVRGKLASEEMADKKVHHTADIRIEDEATIPLAELLGFLGPFEPPPRDECNHCGGNGRCCCQHSCECPDCQGKGYVIDEPPMRQSVVAGVWLDSNLLAKFLAAVTVGGNVAIAADKSNSSMLIIQHESFSLYVMGLENDECSVPGPGLPHFACETVAS